MTTGRFSVSCGGTGGHVFPGLATARELQARGHTVTLWLAGKAIEAASRHAWNGPVVSIRSDGISASPLHFPLSIIAVARAYRASLRALRATAPQVVLAMGSYSSVGPVLAARRLRIPIVLHEANVIPGRTIDVLRRFARAVAISFPETRDHLVHPRLVTTGLPLRKELEEAAARPTPAPDGFTILVMGGSQGARRLNATVSETLCRLHRAGLPIRVLHLSGEHDRPAMEAAYAAAGVPHAVHGFLRDMPTAYRAASFAIARSGANSCMELALFGVPALLVPLPEAVRNHQLANARAMAAAGAADVVEQAGLSIDWLADYLRGCLAAPDRLARMRFAARRRAIVGADRSLADLVEEVAAGR